MIKTNFIIFLLLCATQIAHTQYFGGSYNDKGIAFCQINSDFYITGTTRSFGAGSEDIWIIKTNQDLKSEFNVEWGGIHYEIASDIIASSDNNIITTGASWDAPGGRTTVFLAKYDVLGNILWVSYFGYGHNDYVYSVKESADGGYVITGINRAYGTMGAIFLIKTDSNGVLLWQKFYDTNDKDIGMDVVECADSSFMILATTSSFFGKISNSSEYIRDNASLVILIKTDKNGNELWRKFYGGVEHDFAKKIILDGNNNYYFIGSSLNDSNGSFDITLHKIDGSGTTLWKKNYGGTGYEYGNDIDIDSVGNLLLTGTSSSFSASESPDIYVLKVDSSGNEIWAKTFGDVESDYGNSGQFLANGEIGILGSSKGRTGEDLDVYFITLSESGEVIKALDEIISTGNTQPIIFPNPTSAYINIDMGDHSINQSLEIEFVLYDINGKVIQQNTFIGHSKTIHFNNRLAQGVYIYQITANENTFKGKIVIN
jgi:hypothetical protein